MGVPSTNPSLIAVRNDLDLGGNFNVRHARGMDRLQKFSGNISLSEYAGSCLSIQRVSPAIDGATGSYAGNRNTPSYYKEGYPSSPICAPQGNGWRVQARGNGNPNDQWVEARFYGRVNEGGTYRLQSNYQGQSVGQFNGRFAQVAVVSFSAGYGVGTSNLDYLLSNLTSASQVPINQTFSLTSGRPFVVLYLYCIVKGGQGSNTHTADFTSTTLRKA